MLLGARRAHRNLLPDSLLVHTAEGVQVVLMLTCLFSAFCHFITVHRYVQVKALSRVMADIEKEDFDSGNTETVHWPSWARAEIRFAPQFEEFNEWVGQNMDKITNKLPPGVSVHCGLCKHVKVVQQLPLLLASVLAEQCGQHSTAAGHRKTGKLPASTVYIIYFTYTSMDAHDTGS